MRAPKRSSFPALRSSVPFLLLFALAAILTVGLTACDSSGPNSDDEEENGTTVEQTFTVTVAKKTSNHPYSGEGDDDGYVIDGTQGKELTLTREKTYEFEMGSSVGDVHPFYISTDSVGQGAGVYSDGVDNNNAAAGETLTFTPPSGAPNLLYYQCSSHPKMGWKINITDSSSSDDGGSGGGDDDDDGGGGGGGY